MLFDILVGGCVCMLGIGMIKVLEVYDRMWILKGDLFIYILYICEIIWMLKN